MNSDVDSLLPLKWAWAPMSEVCEKIQDGTHFSPENQQAEGKYPYVTAKNVRPYGLDLSDLTYLSEEDHRQIYQRCDPIRGDVLLVKDGVNMGDAAINTFQGEISLLSSVTMLRPRQAILNNRFLRYFLQSPDGFRLLAGQMTGTAIKRIILRRIRDTPVPIAPLSEQERIVAKIEELFSDLDAGVAALNRAKANLKRYRAAVLKAAVEGKLTEQWRAEHPATEPASKLLERILAERRKKWEADQLAKYAAAGKTPPKDWQKKYIEPTKPDAAGLPDLPKQWCWVGLEQVANAILGKMLDKAKHTSGQRLLYLRNVNIRWGTISTADTLTMFFRESDCARFNLKAGDVLVCEGGEPGRCAVWDGRLPEMKFQKALHRVRLFGNIEPRYLVCMLEHLAKSGRLELYFTGSTIKHFTRESFVKLPIPLPPLAEQAVIVGVVEECLSIAAALERQLDQDIVRAARLRQSILKQAFEGKLVAQDPADEPASVLLERIRASREAELHIFPAARATRGRPAANGVRRKQPAGIIFRRGAVVCYIIRTLADRPSFGRTQLEKVLHLTQTHLGVDLALEFERYQAGPFDKSIYKLEGFARKRRWFDMEDRPVQGVRYRPGPNIGERCEAAVAVLGEKRAGLDELLAHVADMDADRAELFATVYAAWNDLLLDGRPATAEAIIAEVYGWDESKKKFTEDRIRRCLTWMRKHGYIPTGTGQRTQLRSPAPEKKSRRGRKKP